jgi:crotonobetainyl-CoA:carnitine CoA-transferase CaiB-like acyl-CoA transferase
MPGPMHGVRVLDLSTALSGPVATMLLADQGADVVKVEAPGLRDVTRIAGSFTGGMKAMYHLSNRGKRAVTLDVRDPAGLEVFHALVRDVDVVVQNFRPGIADRLGIGYDAVREHNEAVVYVSIAGFGFDGPLAGAKVFDNLIQAASGFAALQGDEHGPRYVRNLVCDKITALTVAQAVSAALFARANGAGGQHVKVSMLDAAAWFLWPDAGSPHAMLDPAAVSIDTNRSNELVRHVDGWTTCAPVTDDEFRGWCRAFDAAEFADDPRFATARQRLESSEYPEVRRAVTARAARFTVAEALARLAANGITGVEAIGLDHLHEQEQIAANGTFSICEHPVGGRIRQVEPAARFGATPARAGGPAPMPGEHTDEVLLAAGCPPATVERLRRAGVLG